MDETGLFLLSGVIDGWLNLRVRDSERKGPATIAGVLGKRLCVGLPSFTCAVIGESQLGNVGDSVCVVGACVALSGDMARTSGARLGLRV